MALQKKDLKLFTMIIVLSCTVLFLSAIMLVYSKDYSESQRLNSLLSTKISNLESERTLHLSQIDSIDRKYSDLLIINSNLTKERNSLIKERDTAIRNKSQFQMYLKAQYKNIGENGVNGLAFGDYFGVWSKDRPFGDVLETCAHEFMHNEEDMIHPKDYAQTFPSVIQ